MVVYRIAGTGMAQNELKSILKRLEKLENTVFAAGRKPRSQKRESSFAGPSGGARLLISRGFFKIERDALAKHGYHYGVAQIQMALNRLSTRRGPLTTSKDSGKKAYVERK
jgi:hypothetical protein